MGTSSEEADVKNIQENINYAVSVLKTINNKNLYR